MPRTLRLLILTHHAGLPTGLAESTRLIFGTLLAEFPNEYEVWQVGLCSTHAVTTVPWPIFPTIMRRNSEGINELLLADLNGEITYPRVLASVQPDIVFLFNDPQNIKHACIPATERPHRLIAYVTCDAVPLPENYEFLRHVDRLFCMSQFGKDALIAACEQHQRREIKVVYSPADLSRFTPVSEAERQILKSEVLGSKGVQNPFVIGWCGRNQWRKQIWAAYCVTKALRTGAYVVCDTCGCIPTIDFSAICAMNGTSLSSHGEMQEWLLTECPECGSRPLGRAEPQPGVVLYAHIPGDDACSPWSRSELHRVFNIETDVDVYYTSDLLPTNGLKPADMAIVHGLCDVLLYLSGGEGFGLPAWEAMCSGVPVVYTDYSSHAEFLREAQAGLAVSGVLQPEPGSCTLRLIADVRSAIRCLRGLICSPLKRQQLGRSGRRYCERYSTTNTARLWHSVFKELSHKHQSDVKYAVNVNSD